MANVLEDNSEANHPVAFPSASCTSSARLGEAGMGTLRAMREQAVQIEEALGLVRGAGHAEILKAIRRLRSGDDPPAFAEAMRQLNETSSDFNRLHEATARARDILTVAFDAVSEQRSEAARPSSRGTHCAGTGAFYEAKAARILQKLLGIVPCSGSVPCLEGGSSCG